MKVRKRVFPLAIPSLLLLATFAPTSLGQDDTGETGGNRTGICREVDPNDAKANGDVVVARIKAPGINQVIRAADTAVVGPGDDAAGHDPIKVQIPVNDGSLVDLRLLRAESRSTVASNLNAFQTSTAEVADLSILDGAVQARVVKSHGRAWTTDTLAEESGNGSFISELVVEGITYHQVSPNLIIPLNISVFGQGSHVTVYERIDHGRFPTTKHPYYRANITIAMIHVVAVKQGIDIAVAEAFAHAQTPTPYCGPPQASGAAAYVARIRPPSAVMKNSVVVGYTKVPEVGGDSRETYTDLLVPTDGATLRVNVAESRSQGKVIQGNISRSDAVSKLADVCIREQGEDECLIRAEAIRSESHSRAFEDPNVEGDMDAWSWGRVTLVNLTIAGFDVCEVLGQNGDDVDNQDGDSQGRHICKPPKNTYIDDFKGLGIHVWLNKRFRDMDPEGHTEYWTYAVIIKADDLGEIRLGATYTKASYGTTDDT